MHHLVALADQDVSEDAGRKGLSLPGDVTGEAYCRDIVEQTVAELGGIDILVNSATYQMAREGLEDISTDELEHTPAVERSAASGSRARMP